MADALGRLRADAEAREGEGNISADCGTGAAVDERDAGRRERAVTGGGNPAN